MTTPQEHIQAAVAEFDERFAPPLWLNLNDEHMVIASRRNIKSFMVDKMKSLHRTFLTEQRESITKKINSHKLTNTYDGEESRVFETTLEEVRPLIITELNAELKALDKTI